MPSVTGVSPLYGARRFLPFGDSAPNQRSVASLDLQADDNRADVRNKRAAHLRGLKSNTS